MCWFLCDLDFKETLILIVISISIFGFKVHIETLSNVGE